MSRNSLPEFIARALADNRILFGDLKRLQRDILPARITTREEAESLLLLDSAVERADRDWTVYLTSNVRDFVIWGLSPAGSLDRNKAEWISAALSHSPSKAARTIIHEIVHEARSVDNAALLDLGMRGPQRRRPPTAQLPARKLPSPLSGSDTVPTRFHGSRIRWHSSGPGL